MPERYAFYITRDNQLKVAAPVIDHLLSEYPGGLKPLVIFHSHTSKPLSQPTHESVQAIFGDLVETRAIDHGREMTRMAGDGEFGVWLNVTTKVHEITPDDFAGFVLTCRRQGIKVVALPHTFETEMFVVANLEDTLRNWDLVNLVGKKSRQYLEQAVESADLRRRILDRCVVTGYPEMDQIAGFDNQAIRRKLDLPMDKPIICLGTAAHYYRDNGLVKLTGERFKGFTGLGPQRIRSWLRSRRGTPVVTYRRYLSALAKMAHRNGALLVAKTRSKHRDPDYLNNYVDLVFSDREFYPFTTLELLFVSDIYFGFYSTMAMEANSAGKNAFTSIHVPPIQVETPPYLEAAQYLYLRQGASWNCPGVSEILWGDKPRTRERLRQMARSGLDEFKVPEERLEFWMSEYLHAPGRASANVIAAIESL